jgi:hypothetical protein
MPPLRNLWKYNPKIKGLCTGVVLCGFGFSAIILNKISNIIINPDHVNIDKTTEFYPEYIGLKVPNYYFVTSIIVIIFGLFASLLIFEYEDKKYDIVEDNKTSDLIVYNSYFS